MNDPREFLVCLTCYNYKGGKIRPCDSCGNELIAIDENLAPIILTLNKKGYITWACCSSHLYDRGGYLIFNEKYDLPEMNIDGFQFGLFNGNSEIRWVNKDWEESDDTFKTIKQIHQMMYQLNDYVNSLPSK